MPGGCEALAEAFRELNAARGSNGYGPQALTYQEIAAWCALNGVTLSPWEIETLAAMDAEAMRAMHEKKNSGRSDGNLGR